VTDSKYWDPAEFASLPFELANGFTPTSKCILMFIDLISSFTRDEQMKFLTFLTGSPRLPLGGMIHVKTSF
jgi:hypothetical protein